MPLSPEESRERRRENNRRYAAAHPERVRERARRYREEHAEELAAAGRLRYAENREKERERGRRYRQENLEEVRARGREKARARRAADPERAREIDRQRWFRDQEKIRARNRAVGPAKRLKSQHGMTPEQWAEMWIAQMGRCYLCGDELPRDRKQVHIDHDHTCCAPNTSCRYCRRGLACGDCNTAIGLLRDDPDRMELVAANLRVALAVTRERIAAKPVQADLFTEEQIPR